MDRHPLYVAYYAQLERENSHCLLRAGARNKMKRFVTDVETLWLTNLAHHPEHGREGCVDAAQGLERGEAARRGIAGARDTPAILARRSQIQSVRPERAFEKAVFFASTSDSRGPVSDSHDEANPVGGLVLDGETSMVEDSGTGTKHRCADVLPAGWTPPTLPPRPPAPPELLVFARERPAVIERSAAATPASLTSRSARTAGSSSASPPDPGRRMLRVLRFALAKQEAPRDAAPAPDPVTSISSGCDDQVPETPAPQRDHGRDGREASPGTPQAELPGSRATSRQSAARWMITSYNPHDGSESCFVLEDRVVRAATAAALSRIGPGPNAADDDSGQGLQETRRGRCLLTRRGRRVPVLDSRGEVSATVLSVIEVNSEALGRREHSHPRASKAAFLRPCRSPTQPSVGARR